MTRSLHNFGFSIIDFVEIEIGGQCIDKHYGHWLTIWTDLTHNDNKAALLSKMTIPDIENMPANVDKKYKLYIPLQFWFCRNPGLSLPLIALQYHEVKINIQFNDYSKIKKIHDLDDYESRIDDANIYCDYIFLDTDERRRFAQVSHEYLIDQVQYSLDLNAGTPHNSTQKVNVEADLRFNHPVKELVWTVGNNEEKNVEVDSALLQLNGHDRFKSRKGSYFTDVQRYQHHSGSSGNRIPHIFSFALKPEEHQPSGSCNFSRIDNALLNLSYKSPLSEAHTLRVYGVNYNVLRIMSGMGGLAYSN